LRIVNDYAFSLNTRVIGDCTPDQAPNTALIAASDVTAAWINNLFAPI
jgi:hypothetical protein